MKEIRIKGIHLETNQYLIKVISQFFIQEKNWQSIGWRRVANYCPSVCLTTIRERERFNQAIEELRNDVGKDGVAITNDTILIGDATSITCF